MVFREAMYIWSEQPLVKTTTVYDSNAKNFFAPEFWRGFIFGIYYCSGVENVT
jgi:hypothetical protein